MDNDLLIRPIRFLAGIQRRRSRKFEWDHVRSDGTVIPVEVSMTAINRGVKQSLHISWKDITDRRRLANEIEKSTSFDLLGNLAGRIAHDLNNRLVPVLAYADLLGNELKDNPRLMHWSQEIGRAGLLSASLAKNLLAITRPQNPSPQVFDLADTPERLLASLRTLVGNQVELLIDRDGGPFMVKFDQEDWDQVLFNLAAYARDALPDGGCIRLTLFEQGIAG